MEITEWTNTEKTFVQGQNVCLPSCSHTEVVISFAYFPHICITKTQVWPLFPTSSLVVPTAAADAAQTPNTRVALFSCSKNSLWLNSKRIESGVSFLHIKVYIWLVGTRKVFILHNCSFYRKHNKLFQIIWLSAHANIEVYSWIPTKIQATVPWYSRFEGCVASFWTFS